MTKPTFTDEFKQGVVQYVLDIKVKIRLPKLLQISGYTLH